MEKYRQQQRKEDYAQHTYNWKSKFYGKEKPEEYDLLVKHFRRAIVDTINNIAKHNKVISRDKHFLVTYNTKEKLFGTFSLRTAKNHININYKGRLQDISSKERYLKGRLKFWSTEKLEEFGGELHDYVKDMEEKENEYEMLSATTLDDVLAALLYNVSFIPVGKVVSPDGRKDKSLELKTNDLASRTWVDTNGGVSLGGYADSLLKESYTNGLAEVGYAVSPSEYGDGGNVDQWHGLQDDIRHFISSYTSSSSYFKEKKKRIREIEKYLYTPQKELSAKYGIYVDRRNCWLLLAIIDDLLNERDPDRTKNFMPSWLPPVETSEGNLDTLLHSATHKPSGHDGELPF